MSHPMEQMAAMASLMLEGALERHPGMRVAFLESGTGWLPYWLARLQGAPRWVSLPSRPRRRRRTGEWTRERPPPALPPPPGDASPRQCMISTDPDDPL